MPFSSGPSKLVEQFAEHRFGFRHLALPNQFVGRTVRFVGAGKEPETRLAGTDLGQRVLHLLVVGRVGQQIGADRDAAAFRQ